MKPVRILLVEDNPGDVILTKEALQHSRIANEISVAKDGEQAIDMLFKKGEYKEYHLPELILLDINLPKINGKEVLAKIKDNDLLKVIPVIMLTTSNADNDITEAYQHHANCYIVKPVNIDKFLEVIGSIKNFWLTIVEMPKVE